MKMTTEKAQSVLMQLVRYHFGLISEAPSRLEIEQAHYFIRTELSFAKQFQSAISPEGFTLWSADILSEFGYGCLNETELTNYKVYLVPKEKDNEST